MEHSDNGRFMGHEAIGIVEAVGGLLQMAKRTQVGMPVDLRNN
jgi:threonine dehydrogenase-like Zn-dependent dehydrogenase